MYEIKNIPNEMREQADKLREGKLLIVYKDGDTVHCETEKGKDPYVWRKGKWHRMKV